MFSSSFAHNVVPKDKWLAFVSTTVETSNPEAELAPGQPCPHVIWVDETVPWSSSMWHPAAVLSPLSAGVFADSGQCCMLALPSLCRLLLTRKLRYVRKP